MIIVPVDAMRRCAEDDGSHRIIGRRPPMQVLCTVVRIIVRSSKNGTRLKAVLVWKVRHEH
jgi:hypothetical protein